MSGTWLARVKREHLAGNLTHAARIVLEQLAAYFGQRGEAWPSHATLAERAGCDVRTVQRALHAARGLGLVEWTERRIRAGWRSLRTSNLYRLLMPEGAVQRRSATTGQFGRGEETKEKKGARESSKGVLATMLAAARGLPDLLAARRAALEARWRGLAEARAR